jgi:hypothetical protein
MYLRKVAELRYQSFAFLMLVCICVGPSSVRASNLPQALDGSLALYYPFDETAGTTAPEDIGGDDGTLMNFNFGSPSGWVNGVHGNALSFDGLNDYVSLSGGALNLTNNFTVSVWLSPRNASGGGAFLSVRSSYRTSGLRFFILRNSLLLQGLTKAGWKSVTLAQGAFQNGVWYHVAIVYNKPTITAFVNGVNQGSNAVWYGGFVMNPAYPTKIGTEGIYYFNGTIDEVMVFNRSLTAGEVHTIYQNSTRSDTTLDNTPSPPANLVAQALSPMQVYLSWQDNSSNELGFVVERATSLAGPWTQIATVGANTTSYTDPTAAPSTAYYYRVGAFN